MWIAKYRRKVLTGEINEIFREFPHFARGCWSRKLWADGYFVRAAGDKAVADEIQRYVRYQTKERKSIQLDLFQERIAKQ